MKKQKLHFSRLLSLALSIALLCTALSVPFSVSAAGNGVNSGTSATNPWDGDVAEGLQGTGSSKDPYKINNAEDLAYLAQKCGYLGNNKSTEGLETINKHFELTTDIYLNDVSTEWYKNPTDATGLKVWKNTGTFTHSGGTGTAVFNGRLHGNGHKIYGLYMNDDNATNGGLFANINANASIENLGIEKSYIAVSMSSGNAGAFAGNRSNWDGDAAITNCYSSDTVTIKGANAGGLVGNSYHSLTFTNCYSSAVLTGTKKGGIVGYAGYEFKKGIPYLTLNYCYSASSNVELIGNFASRKKYEGCYATVGTNTENNNGSVTKLTVAQMTGDAAYENMPGFDFNKVWHVFDGGTPKLRVFDFPGKNLDPEIWDGETVATQLSLKDPSKPNSSTNPYLISNGAELVYFVQKGVDSLSGARKTNANGATKADGTNYKYTYSFEDQTVFATGGKFFELTNDIYLNDVSTNWYDSAYEGDRSNLNPLINQVSLPCTRTFDDDTQDNPTIYPGFSGTLDGKGHKIYGLYTPGIARAGLLYDGNNCKIKNLGIEKSYILGTSNNNAGAFLSQHTWGTDTFNNCYVSNTVTVKAHKAGGFVGYSGNKIIFTDCYSSANVETASATTSYCGAFVAQNTTETSTFTRCFSTQSKLCFVGYDKTLVFNYVNCYAVDVPLKETSTGSGVFVKVITDESKLKKLTAAEMLGDGMTAIVNDTANWVTNPKSTPTLAVFPIDGDVNGDKSVDICDLVLAKQVSLGTAGYNLINFATTNLDNEDGLYTINEADINRIRAGKLLGLDF